MSALLRAISALPLAGRLAAEFRSPPPDARARHDRAIRAIIGRAGTKPFYRSLWQRRIDPWSGGSAITVLETLPVVSHQDWRAAPADEIESEAGVGRVIRLTTGGSTGEPLAMPYTAGDYRRMRAGIQATMRLHGARWTSRMLRFLPPDVDMPGGRELFGRLRHVGSRATTEERAAALAHGGWGILRSYPWPAWRAVVHSHRHGLAVPPIAAMFAGGEVLTAIVRRALQRALGGRVVDRYAATDWGLIAADCPIGRLHAMAPFVHLEILTGDSPAAPGTVGDVVVTNLCSTARPVVRVRTGDRAAWDERPCQCGNRAPVLAFVVGRSEDSIRLSSRRNVLWPELDTAVSPFGREVLGWQAEQVNEREVVVRVSVAEGATVPPALSSALAGALAGMQVSIVVEDGFRRAANGKTRPIIGLPREEA